MKNKLTGS